MKFIIGLFSFVFLINSVLADVEPYIKKALNSSVMVVIPEQAAGSGVAFYRDKRRGKTLIASNDHVCQATRGKVFLTGEINFRAPLNSFKMYVKTAGNGRYRARVAYTSNVHTSSKKKPKSDLCIIEILEKMPFGSHMVQVGNLL